MQAFHPEGNVLTRVNDHVWACQVTRFLLDHYTDRHPLELIAFNVTTQHFVLFDDVLYMHKNANFTDGRYFVTEGSTSDDVFRVDVEEQSSSFDLKMTKIHCHRSTRKGQRHPRNLLPLDHPDVLCEEKYNRILRHEAGSRSAAGKLPQALSLLLRRYEGVPIIGESMAVPEAARREGAVGARRANVWWIRTQDGFMQEYYIRFMDALVLDFKGTSYLHFRSRPYGLYAQTDDHEEVRMCDYFFRKIRKT